MWPWMKQEPVGTFDKAVEPRGLVLKYLSRSCFLLSFPSLQKNEKYYATWYLNIVSQILFIFHASLVLDQASQLSNGKHITSIDPNKMRLSVVRNRETDLADIEEILPRKKRQKVETDSTTKLCMHCQQLDLDTEFEFSLKAFQHARSGKLAIPNGISEASDGRYYYQNAFLVHQFGDRLSTPSDCPMCQFFRSLRIGPDDYECHKLLAFRSSDCWLFRGDLLEQEADDQLQEYSDNVFVAVVPDVDTIPLDGYEADWLDHDIPATGAIYRLQWHETREFDPNVLLRAKELGYKADLVRMQEWLQICRECHGDACRRRAVHEPISRSFRLINCNKKPPTVEDHDWGTTYAALSYVWGVGPEDTTGWPKTILDAVKVTRKLGLDYLWVDRLCINQSDQAERDYLISRMTTIYEAADFTIVAAAGSGASHGLPGVRSTPRLPQPKYYLDGGSLLLSVLRDPRRDILESQYWTRGWTYQEGILSNRRIVFTQSQVYWECRCMATHESLDMPLFHMASHREEEKSTHDVMSYFMLSGIFKGNASGGGANSSQDNLIIDDDAVYRLDYGFPIHEQASLRAQLRSLNEHVREFSKRELSHDTDTLPAFLGIAGLFRQFDAMCLFYGLPVWIGQVAGSPRGAQISFALSVSSWYHRTSPELYMYVSSLCRRKSHLPSWTWAGWHGTVTWRAPPDREHSSYMTDLINATISNLLWAPDIYLCYPNGSTPIRLLDTHSNDRLRSETPTLIEIRSPLALSSFRRKKVGNKEWLWTQGVGRTGREEGTTRSPAWDADWYRIGSRLALVAVSIRISESEWTAKHKSGELVSVLMFAGKYLDNKHGTARFLTLRRKTFFPDRWERVGTLYLIIPCLDTCSNNQELLKKIPVKRRDQRMTIQ